LLSRTTFVLSDQVVGYKKSRLKIKGFHNLSTGPFQTPISFCTGRDI